MRFKAVFFDRDGTLLAGDPQIRAGNRARIERWSGKPYQEPSYDEMMVLFDKAGYPKEGHKSVESEMAFWPRYYRELLLWAGVSERLEERARELFEATWLKNLKLYPETVEVLEYFRRRGFRMGVISDTSPSLELTLQAAGIGQYFDCAVCSDLVGAEKPDPKIYQAALDALGVKAEESLYVDDYDVEADGARTMGFTAFHIDRSRPGDGKWRISSLNDMVEFVEKNG